MNIKTYPVKFIGAGPGDPELITVKGQKALAAADLVIYAGSLVPEALLTWTRTGAISISSAAMNLIEIIDVIEKAYHEGQRVVRLHTGDPALYGAIFEQMTELEKRAIAYEVIPGVSAAFAAAAAMGLEYTLPEISQTLILTRMAGRTPVPDTEALEKLAGHQTSMAIYLSISLVEQVAAVLAKTYGANAACAIAYRVSQPEEKIVRTTVGKLAEAVHAANITRQAIIIVGRVLEVTAETLAHTSKLYDQAFSHGFRK
jgi:precorrin-4/cobalt-precorrin-4 C11-methyltransferase